MTIEKPNKIHNLHSYIAGVVAPKSAYKLKNQGKTTKHNISLSRTFLSPEMKPWIKILLSRTFAIMAHSKTKYKFKEGLLGNNIIQQKEKFETYFWLFGPLNWEANKNVCLLRSSM